MRKGYQWIGLSLCLILLIGVYWYINRPESSPEPEATAERDLDFWDFTEEDISQLVLIGSQNIALEQTEAGWQVAGLDPELTNHSQVSTVVRRFATLEADFVLETEPDDLSKYGLAKPSVTVKAELADGSEKVVYLGNRHPTEYLFYLMVEGDAAVYAVNGMYGTAFQSTLENFRKRELGSFNLADLNRLVIHNSGQERIEIAAAEDPAENLKGLDRLRFISPYRTPLRIAALENYAKFTLDGGLFLSLRVKDFIDLNPEDLAQYGLDQPQGELLIEDRASSIHLLLGNERNDLEVYAMLAGGSEVFSIYKNLIRIRDADPFEWLIKVLYMVSIDDVNRVDVTWDDQHYVLTMEREEIVVEEDGEPKTEIKESFYLNGIRAEERIFRRTYGTIVGLTVDAVLDQIPDEVGEPEFKLVFYHEDPERLPVTIELLPYSRDLYATRIEGVVEFVIARDKVESVKQHLTTTLAELEQ
jgi:hypothetical protein